MGNAIKLHFRVLFQTYPDSRSKQEMKDLVRLLFQIKWNILVSAKVINFSLTQLQIRTGQVGLSLTQTIFLRFFFCCCRHNAKTLIIHLLATLNPNPQALSSASHPFVLLHLSILRSGLDQSKRAAENRPKRTTCSRKHLQQIIYSYTACWVVCIRPLLCINRTKTPKETSQGTYTLSKRFLGSHFF